MNRKKYLPVERFVLVTKLPAEEVMKRLADNIEPKKWFRFSLFGSRPGKPYEGEISGSYFTMRRIIGYRNSFLPVTRGNTSAFLGNTEIKISMRPPVVVFIFISFWLGIVSLACLVIVLSGILQWRQLLQNGFSLILLIPFGMFVFGYLLVMFGFKAEAKKQRFSWRLFLKHMNRLTE